MKKLIVTSTESMMVEKANKLRCSLAELYGVEEEDVVFLPAGVSASVVECASPKKAKAKEDLHSKTVEELREMARSKEINLHGASTKDEIVDAIEKAS